GNQDIACLTCHHPTLNTDDNRPLPLGTGGVGLGMNRVGGHIVPRNAPELFNRHMFDGMFWDARVAMDDQGRFLTPAGNHVTPAMQQVLRDGYGALGAQAMFPPTSPVEMRGQPGENPIADIRAGEFTQIWNAYMTRIGNIPQYVTMFEAAYPGTSFQDMSMAHVGNAIGAFESQAFLSTGSPFHRFVAGDDDAMTEEQIDGALDYFAAGCGTCHGGPMLSDADFHNTGVPQIGTGTRGGVDNRDDFGRILVTGHPRDRYAFRSPSLHNVELTGPWGHAGQFGDLRVYIEHYIDIEGSLRAWRPEDNVIDPSLWNTQYDNFDNMLENLSPGVVSGVPAHLVSDEMMVFMGALTDPAMLDLTHLVPASVPSGLPVGGL
ncbi:MAG: cytochrome-c peroxidase, partial [Alphaproteobacteria bacterium]|nr:cytochrome-c peroxidase [Alphaproteobacteria bacterium]